MCAPAALAGLPAMMQGMSTATMFAASLGVSALTAGAQYISQAQQATAQVEAQQANINATADAANASLVQQNTDLHARESQEQAATALRLNNARIDADKARAEASAGSESSGLSFSNLMADYESQYAAYADSEMIQLGFNLDQIQRTREGIAATAQSRINTIPRTPVQQPSLLTAAASIGGSALGAYDKYSVRDPITGIRTLT